MTNVTKNVEKKVFISSFTCSLFPYDAIHGQDPGATSKFEGTAMRGLPLARTMPQTASDVKREDNTKLDTLGLTFLVSSNYT